MTMVRANGWDFYCESVGSGPDLVFIHGEIHGIDYWEHQIADLSRDHRCLIYERRGHRRTGMPARSPQAAVTDREYRVGPAGRGNSYRYRSRFRDRRGPHIVSTR